MLLLSIFKESAYGMNFCYMSKDDAINIMNGSNLVDSSISNRVVWAKTSKWKNQNFLIY